MRHLAFSFSFGFLGIVLALGVHAEEDALFEASLDDLLNLEVSTAAKYKQTTREAPSSVTIVTSEDIEHYGYRNLEDVFRSVRGFYTSNDRNYGYVGVRGFSRPTDYNNRVLLLVNGQTANENVWGSAGIGNDFSVSMDSIERIEIVRGPGSALYGTSAMFAVVNLITKTGNAVDGLQASAEIGSYGTVEGAALIGKELDNGLDFIFSGRWFDSDGQDLYFAEYDDPASNNGVAQDLDWGEAYSAAARLTYKDFSLQGSFSSGKKGVPTGAYEVNFNTTPSETVDEIGLLEAKYDGALAANKQLMVRSALNYYHYEGAFPYEAVWFDKSYGAGVSNEIQYRWDLRADNRLIVGAEYQNHFKVDYRAWDVDEVYFDRDEPFNVVSFYIQDEYQITRDLSLTLGLRRDDYSTVGSTTTPRGALVYHPSASSTVKLLYGEAFRAPNMYEINYADFAYKANLDLRPETIRTFELVWEQRLSQALLGTATFYRYTMEDLIDQIEDPADALIQHQNVNQVSARGVELGLDLRLAESLQGYGSYVYQDAEDDETKQTLSNLPRHMVKMGLTSPLARHFRAAAELQYQSARTTVYETETDPFLLTHLKLTATPQFGDSQSLPDLLRNIQVSLQVRNLFDTDYATPGGWEHLQPAIPQNGRNYTIRIDYSL